MFYLDAVIWLPISHVYEGRDIVEGGREGGRVGRTVRKGGREGGREGGRRNRRWAGELGWERYGWRRRQ